MATKSFIGVAVVVVFAATAPSFAAAGSSAFKKAETAAIIDRTGLPIGALFEAKLIGSTKLKWVERGQIDKVFAEQNVQALFSADAAAQRTALAKTLKADVLAVLRTGVSADAKKSKYLELVAFESQRGLRLATHAIPLTDDANETGELEAAFQRALAKLAEKIVDIVAVPPFLSHDLDYRYNYLAAGFAKSLEQHLQSRKGILLVEFDEAKSLVREAAISGDTVERPLPLFVVGDYRHEGAGDKRRLRIELKFQRGEKLLGTRTRDSLAPDEAAPAMLKLSDELADQWLAATEPGAADRAAEMKQLSGRSLAYQQLGNWPECVALLEAAILLNHEHPELRLRAAHGYSMIVSKQGTTGKAADGVKALHAFRRAMEHVEFALRPRDRLDPPKAPFRGVGNPSYPSSNVRFSMHQVHELRRHSLKDDSFKELFDEVTEFERAIWLDLCRLRARAGYGDDCTLLIWALVDVPLDKQAAIIRSMLQELKDLPFAKERAILYSKLEYYTLTPALQKDSTYLTDLERDSNAGLREAAAFLRVDMVRAEKEMAEFRQATIKAKEDSAKLGGSPAERVALMIAGGAAKGAGKELVEFRGCVPLSPGLDLVLGNGALYLMRERGKLTPLWQAGELNSRLNSVCYDGRYAWICNERSKKAPKLLVLDPFSSKVYEFTADDGLPIAAPETLPKNSTRQYFMAAPLGPGRALLVGAFGRSWIGIATFDPSGGKSVKIFHEARDEAQEEGNTVWKSATMAFDPYCAYTLESPTGERRVVVGRQSRNYSVDSHPLIVDPEAKSVTVYPEHITRQQLVAGQPQNGAVYFVHHANRQFDLVRFEFPGKIVPTGLTKLPEGTAIVVGDDIFMPTGTHWYVGSISKNEFRPVGPNNTRLAGDAVTIGLGHSHHYGFLQGGILAGTFRPVVYQISARLVAEKIVNRAEPEAFSARVSLQAASRKELLIGDSHGLYLVRLKAE